MCGCGREARRPSEKKRGSLANVGQEQEEQVKWSLLALVLEKDDSKVTHSDKMHRATHEDAHAKAWFDCDRNAFPQTVRKASPYVDFYNVPTNKLLSLLELSNAFKTGPDTQKG